MVLPCFRHKGTGGNVRERHIEIFKDAKVRFEFSKCPCEGAYTSFPKEGHKIVYVEICTCGMLRVPPDQVAGLVKEK